MGEFALTSVGPIHFEDHGGEGTPIVLIHGLGGSLTNWAPIAPSLTEAGHVMAIDLPGFGLSPPAADWELDTHVEAIVSFIESKGDSAILIGNSMGGLLSKMTAAEYPELVDGLVLIAPAAAVVLPDPRIHWPTALRLLIQATPLLGPLTGRALMARLSPDEIVRLSLDSITHDRHRVSPEVVSKFEDLARKRYEFPWTPDAVPLTGRSIARIVLRPARYTEMIRKVKAPTLVIQGIADPIVSPTAVERSCWLRPDWELVQLDDTGHTPQLDAPVRTLGVLLPWLESHTKREIAA